MSSTPQPLATQQPFSVGSPIGVPTSAPESEGMSLRDVTRILKQRFLTIVVWTVIFYLLVVLGTGLIHLFVPTYTSEAVFELDPPQTGDPLAPEEAAALNTKNMEQLLQTEASKLKGLGLLLDVVKLPEVKATAYYRWYDSDAMTAAEGLSEDLGCAPIKNTRLIRVALACKDRKEAQTIVQSIVARYTASFEDEVANQLRQRLESLKQTLAAVEKKLLDQRATISKFREGAEVPMMELRRMEARDHVVALRQQISLYDAALASLKTQLDSLEGLDPGLLPLTAEQELIVESDPILRYWRSQVENLDVEMAAVSQLFGPNHRQIRILEKRRAGYFDKELAKREELMDKVRRRQVESLRQEMAQTQNIQARLLEQLEQVKAESRDMDRNLQLYQQMDEDKQRYLEQIAMIDESRTETEHALEDRSRLRLHLRQPPVEAVEPTRPDWLIYLSAGAVLSIFGGIGVAFLKEMTSQSIRTPLDVARYCHMSVLGCIPQLDDEEAEIETIEEAVRVAPHSLVAEAFRRVRNNLQFSGPLEKQRSLLITSPGPGDGKTSVAINLAVTMAHGNQRVLLIDCNFRRPALRSAFKGTRPEGLSNILIGEGKLEDLATHTPLPNLDVLTSGPMPPTPAELLGAPAMAALIKEACEKYDRVLLDGPPTLLISDPTVLSLQVDGVILVTRAEENTRGVLKRARDQLEAVNARIVGAIVNGIRTRAGGYFREQYREFYDYVADETIPPELPGPDDTDRDDDEE